MSVGAVTAARPSEVLGAFGLYIHIPFCEHRCHYCDFNAYSGLDHEIAGYMDALVADIQTAASAPADLMASRPPLTSVFIGGGTPSLVPASDIGRVMDAIRITWDLTEGAEVTIEANPESTDTSKLKEWRDAGVNRVSFGVQQLDPELLKWLGRLHTGQRALDAIAAAREVFHRVSADLIFGVPGETDAGWIDTLNRIVETGVTHVSAYGLTYEPGTPLHEWRRLGKVTPVDDDLVAGRWEAADEILTSAGMARYEISNWAAPGAESAHNANYWRFGEYLGVGAGAHSHLASDTGSVRSWTVKGPAAYQRGVASAGGTVAGSEEISLAGRAAETMMLGLRDTVGINESRFEELCGSHLRDVFPTQIEWSIANGLAEWAGSNFRLTRKGVLLANEVVTRFLT